MSQTPMKNWIAIFAIVTLELPDGAFLGLTQLNMDNSCESVVSSTQTAPCAPSGVVVSTGPVRMKAFNSEADCYEIEKVWSNGVVGPVRWIACPK